MNMLEGDFFTFLMNFFLKYVILSFYLEFIEKMLFLYAKYLAKYIL